MKTTNTNMPECPHCHFAGWGVYRNCRASGYAAESFTELGQDLSQAEMSMDFVTYTRPKTLRCERCGKVRKDLVIDECTNALRKVQG